MDKILTIVIPSYNMEKYLDRCLSSLIVDDGHMKMFEALVINDGSKDKTSEIGHAYEARFPESIRVIDKHNGHYGSCVNCGLAEAKGTFVKILDADDLFDTEAFAEFLDFLNKDSVREQADLILSNCRFVREDNSVIGHYSFSTYTSPFTIGDISSTDRLNWFIHGLTYRTANLTRMGYTQTEGIAYTDTEWIFNPIITVCHVFQFPEYLYNYTLEREGQSMSADQRLKNLQMSFQVVESNLHFYIENQSVPPEIQTFLLDRLNKEITHLYQLCLFNYKRSANAAKLLESFDKYLQNIAPEIYEQTAHYSITIGGLRFFPISRWRAGRQRIRFTQFLYSMADRINQIRLKSLK